MKPEDKEQMQLLFECVITAVLMGAQQANRSAIVSTSDAREAVKSAKEASSKLFV